MLQKFALDFVKITEEAAIAAFSLFGKGDSHLADKIAVDSMRSSLDRMPFKSTIVVGEGERDKAPMLYVGEELGGSVNNEVNFHLALDPLECTDVLANGENGSLTVLAVSNPGSLLSVPDVYMEKIAIGLNFKEKIISLENTLKENLINLSLAKKCKISDLIVVVLDRPRHNELISEIRSLGARVKLIKDGDVAAVINTTKNIDMYVGIGGAPEGILAAAALKTIGGQICTKLLFNNNEQKVRATNMGIVDHAKLYYLDDLVSGDVVFCATGVTDGTLLNGIHIEKDFMEIETLLMMSHLKEVKKIINRKYFLS